MSENEVVVSSADWFKLQYPLVYRQIVKIDNEGIRSVAGHRLAKKMGLSVGASDWFIAYPIGVYHGMWIEFKKEKWPGPRGIKEKARHANQIDFLKKMSCKGYHTAFVVGFDQAREALSGYMKGECHLYQSAYYKPVPPSIAVIQGSS